MIYKSSGSWGLYTLFQFWEYIKGKISSVLGLTATQYNGNANTATTAESANKIEPNYTNVELSAVTSETTKYIKIADCNWDQAGTLQVYLDGNALVDTLVINFGGGNAETPMLCGYYHGHMNGVYSVIARKGSTWNSDYSIYVKVMQKTNCVMHVALLKGNCTINITESTTAPTNISEWNVNYGLFGDLSGNVSGSSGSEMVHTCSTPRATAAKTVSIPGFTLTQGACIRVVFNNGNSAARPTLNVNGTGAKEICGPYGELLNAVVEPPATSAFGSGICTWDYNIVLDLYYNGTEWRVIGNPIVLRFSENSTVHKNISILGNLQTSILRG